jgi:outer membrane receptor for ferrienterochelin and colicins
VSVAVLLALVVSGRAARAADDDGEGEAPTRHRMAETVVTGTKTPHAADEAPVPTQVITREEIEAVQAGGIDAVLSLIPDIYVHQNEQFGLGASTIRMQGADPNKVLILLDGQRFLGGVDGVVDLRDIPAIDIEQIEIIRGPASSLYGSDAMAGVINIRTRSGGDPLHLAGTAAGGSFARQLYNAAVGADVGPVKLFVSGQHDQVKIAELLGPISAQFEDSDELQKRDSVFVRLDYPTSWQNLRLENNYVQEDNPLSKNKDLATGLAWTWNVAPRWTIDLAGSRYGFDRTNDLPGFVEDVDYASWLGEGRTTWAAGDLGPTNHVFVLGMRGRNEGLDSPARTIGGDAASFTAPKVDVTTYQLSPFLQDEIALWDVLTLVIGASFDKHSEFGLAVNPRATLTYRPVDWASASFTVGRGFRAPDLLQLYDVDINNVALVGERVTGYAIVGNPDLDAERDTAFNLNLDANWRDVVRGNVSLFRHEFTDLIANTIACAAPGQCREGFLNPLPDLQGPIFTFDNVSKARTQGVELGVEVAPLAALAPDASVDHRLEVSVGYGYLDAKNESGIAGEDGKRLPFRPEHRVIPSVLYRFEPAGSQVKIWGTYEAGIFADLINSPDQKVDPAWLWNFKWDQDVGPGLEAAGVHVPKWAAGFGLFVQGLNVFDQEIDAAAIVAQRQLFAARQAFLGGVTYKFQ